MKNLSHNANGTHEFAWDGVSFSIPADWNLASYDYRNSITSVTLEDDVAIRLELEWVRSKTRLELPEVCRRYARMSEKLQKAASLTDEVHGLPDGWMAFLYTMADQRSLMTVFHVTSSGRLFCFLRLHFDDSTRKESRRTIELIASTFHSHEKALIPWSFYDISFTLRKDFHLASTAFLAGRKHMVFEWRLRRLYVWFFSLADMMLKNRRLEEWTVDFLNRHKELRGPTFMEGKDGSVIARRSSAYPLGHFEEIGRWSFRYQVYCRHIPERNSVTLAVFNHRSPSDLAMLDGSDFHG